MPGVGTNHRRRHTKVTRAERRYDDHDTPNRPAIGGYSTPPNNRAYRTSDRSLLRWTSGTMWRNLGFPDEVWGFSVISASLDSQPLDRSHLLEVEAHPLNEVVLRRHLADVPSDAVADVLDLRLHQLRLEGLRVPRLEEADVRVGAVSHVQPPLPPPLQRHRRPLHHEEVARPAEIYYKS
eukprot:171232-Pyramimonas_sp.AAC.1